MTVRRAGGPRENASGPRADAPTHSPVASYILAPVGKRIAVIGAGAWGTALAAHAAKLGHDVQLWAREPEVIADINDVHENRLLLSGIALPASLRASSDPAAVLAGAEIVILAPPSAYLRDVASSLAPFLPPDARIAIATKGIESGSLRLMLDVVVDAIPSLDRRALVALSGPSFAREVAAGLPTDIVVAALDEAPALDVQSALHTPFFRVYTSSDPVGVEVGGAMKNVLAIAAGACDGLGLGANARAALVTRGLSEMARLGVALGGDPLTFMGLSGVGDLILTTTGALSRNRTLGIKVAEGNDPTVYLASQRTVAEGFLTAKAAWELGLRLGIELPITEQVHAVLHEGRPLLEALKTLLTRSHKTELWGLGERPR